MNKNILVVIASILILSSCSSLKTRDIVYFSDLQKESIVTEKITQDVRVKVKPGDLLNITVNSLNQESNILFNRGVIQLGNNNRSGNNNNADNIGYLVDNKGQIDFPVLGKINVEGMSLEEVQIKINDELQPYVKNPIVKVRLLNFRITVLGEVNSPSVINMPEDIDRINVLQVVGMAGDITVYGKKEQVLVIREEQGIRTMARLNLNKKDVLNSPYFYLKQNDMVYIEPDKAKVAGTGIIRRNWGFAVGVISTGILLLRVL